MDVTRPIGTDEAIDYLTAHGFTHTRGTTWYQHRRGFARVVVEDPEAMCFTINAFGTATTIGLVWQARLTCAPADVFAATVTAAISWTEPETMSTTPPTTPTPDPAPPDGEPVVNQHGITIAVLHWRDNGNGTEYARIDNGTLIRRPDGTVTAKLQDPTNGKVRSYEMPDTVTAFYALGLCAGRCNGIDGWLEFSLGFGGGGD